MVHLKIAIVFCRVMGSGGGREKVSGVYAPASVHTIAIVICVPDWVSGSALVPYHVHHARRDPSCQCTRPVWDCERAL